MERREPSASGERALQAGGAERSGTPLAAAVYGRAGGVFVLRASALEKARAGRNEEVKRNAAIERLRAFVWGGEA